ncbi:proton-coupled amino acid transporter-like protein CG1139 isoform X2 [Plodia interpunctella]|uniref:proton-coupled amino acid transporter-like protein CG1139 isoform X2 n=1 Tax=Plodia interpunctella TaxID=58824 RepID=UPI002367888E|nr:proton-coupled amino acid transporter-like protein CG1139 isoform X2 [Plodia interpunctella]XP_053621006.1 proton-coupled amino acid transporter-like protein CG1139 isoform X2 [Plodia interpunctella]
MSVNNFSPTDDPEFKLKAKSQIEEDAFDFKLYRNLPRPTGIIGSIAHIVKGALGGGILGAHVSFMKAGIGTAIPLTILLGVYMAFCLHLLVQSAQVLYRRTRIPTMSYPEVGEYAMQCFPNPKVARFSKAFRFTIDAVVTFDLLGACACYQLIIAKTIKQLVENTATSDAEPLYAGGWHLKAYLAVMIVPIILICLIQHLKWLAPFSIAANIAVLIAIFMAVYYAFSNNPSFTNMHAVTSPKGQLEFIGMVTFGMSCSGVVFPVENNMKEPHKFKYALAIGMCFTISCTFLVSFFGYAAFLENCMNPITLNFSMTLTTKVFKACVAAMIYITHALNFWVPFNLCFHYLKKLHKSNFQMWELIYRAIFVTGIAIVAIIYPDINGIMGFLGTFCLSNMAFIWPNVITILVIWERPGFGKYKWRLWRSLIFIAIGIFLFICGCIVNVSKLVAVFSKSNT